MMFFHHKDQFDHSYVYIIHMNVCINLLKLIRIFMHVSPSEDINTNPVEEMSSGS